VRIAFLCASLEPGHDGVGDYARDLAAACSVAGHSSTLIALNDRAIGQEHQERQISRGVELETLRLAAAESWPRRLRTAQQWLQRAAPDVISLQFVIYGYHPKGLIGDLARHLHPVVGSVPLHLMLHELWIGIYRGSPLRRRLMGHLQRAQLLRLIRTLAPIQTHTSNSTFQRLLSRHGVATELLPLHGNIPTSAPIAPDWLTRELIAQGIPRDIASSSDGSWRLGLFGSFFPDWPPEPFFSLVGQAAAQARRTVVVTSIGRRGAGQPHWDSLARRYAGRFHFAALGERRPEEISTFLQSLDFGVALTPWQLIGKSGSAAAMIDHGVPVIVAGEPQDYEVAPDTRATASLHPLSSDLPAWLLQSKRKPPQERVWQTVERLTTDLAAALKAPRARDYPLSVPSV
jgi:hypothetical protein